MADRNCSRRCFGVMDSTVNLERVSIKSKVIVLQQCVRVKRGVYIPPTRHMAEATHATAYAERTLTTKLNSHEAEGLITRRHQCKLGATKDIRWEGGEFRCGIN